MSKYSQFIILFHDYIYIVVIAVVIDYKGTTVFVWLECVLALL